MSSPPSHTTLASMLAGLRPHNASQLARALSHLVSTTPSTLVQTCMVLHSLAGATRLAQDPTVPFTREVVAFLKISKHLLAFLRAFREVLLRWSGVLVGRPTSTEWATRERYAIVMQHMYDTQKTAALLQVSVRLIVFCCVVV